MYLGSTASIRASRNMSDLNAHLFDPKKKLGRDSSIVKALGAAEAEKFVQGYHVAEARVNGRRQLQKNWRTLADQG